MAECVKCDLNCDGHDPKYLLEEWKLCPKHAKEIKEKLNMDCSFCGSQDTTYKTGIGKTGKWEAYDCNEKQCLNDKGYPNRTWVPKKRVPAAKPNGTTSPDGMKDIHRKLDLIMKALKITEVVKEDSPF